MQVILGRYMDGGAWPDAVTAFGGGAKAVDGVKICGPAGFLSLLVLKLGLPVREEVPGRRTALWEERLRRRVGAVPQEGEPFYAASFRTDGWNTAKRLLQMRDELKDGLAKIRKRALSSDDSENMPSSGTRASGTAQAGESRTFLSRA